VQDRDPSHSQALQSTLASNGTEALKLPPHSPSFSTLDSGFWGTVKAKRLYKTAAKEQLTWAEQCKLLVQVLRQTLHGQSLYASKQIVHMRKFLLPLHAGLQLSHRARVCVSTKWHAH
jgi:hypothetical protein